VLNLKTAEERYGVTHLDHLDKQAHIPVVSVLAAQGDVLIRRNDAIGGGHTSKPIPTGGFPVVRGENGGNTHAVYGNGFYTPAVGSGPGDLLLGVLTVPAGEQVLLSHPEHGGLLIEPGTYECRRQREQADEIRLVQD
jgi:hypothetical protein